MIFMAKSNDETKDLSVQDKIKLIRIKRSRTEKIKRKFLQDGGKLKEGQGRGMEPDPLCECHSRNPCPIDIELNK